MFRTALRSSTVAVGAGLLALTSIAAAAEPVDPSPSARLADIQEQITQIEAEMGHDPAPPFPVTVRHAGLDEIYFLSQALHRKANELLFEWTLDRHGGLVRGRQEEIGGPQVDTLLEDTETMLHVVADTLGIPAGERLPAAVAGGGGDDELLARLMEANRRLNGILLNETGPPDVFQEVSLAVRYASNLLSVYPGVERIPGEEAVLRRKRPRDVHQRLRKCLTLIGGLREKGDPPLTVSFGDPAGEIVPGDVHDLATLVVAGLSGLYRRAGFTAPPREPVAPGNKIPSQAYQRVGLLERQLTELTRLAVHDPGPLRGGGK